MIRISILVLVLLSASASAQQGTAQEQEACRDDAKRFCAHAIVDTPFTVASCFRAHIKKLSPKCRAVLKQHGIE